MKRLIHQLLAFVVLGGVALSCIEDEPSYRGDYYGGITASDFKLTTADSIYAQNLRLNVEYTQSRTDSYNYEMDTPAVTNRITKLNVTSVSGMEPHFANGENLNQYFLVEKRGYYNNDLYTTIEDYLKEKSFNSSYIQLVFTNLSDIKDKTSTIVQDTLRAEIRVDIEFTTNEKVKTATHSVNCVIIP